MAAVGLFTQILPLSNGKGPCFSSVFIKLFHLNCFKVIKKIFDLNLGMRSGEKTLESAFIGFYLQSRGTGTFSSQLYLLKFHRGSILFLVTISFF